VAAVLADAEPSAALTAVTDVRPAAGEAGATVGCLLAVPDEREAAAFLG
jgi:hypothetical protein